MPLNSSRGIFGCIAQTGGVNVTSELPIGVPHVLAFQFHQKRYPGASSIYYMHTPRTLHFHGEWISCILCTFYTSPLPSASPLEASDLSLNLLNSKSDMLSAAAAKKHEPRQEVMMSLQVLRYLIEILCL